MNPEEALAAELRALGRTVTVAPPDGLDAAVLARLRPARRRVARPVAVVAVAVVLGLLAAPPVRAAVAGWVRLAGAVVHLVPGPGPTTAPAPPRASGASLSQVRVPFQALTLPGLGAPDGVEVSPDGRRLSQSWDRPGAAADVIRLDQFDATLDYAFVKTTPQLEWLTVDGRTAIWFDRPHELALLDPDGSPQSSRVAGHTLVWETGDSVLRLEGGLTRDEAVELAVGARNP